MKLHRFSVAMALVFPLMDFSGPEFVSLTYFSCLCAFSPPSVQPQSDVCDFSSKCLQHNPREKNSSLSDLSRDQEGKTDQRQHFFNYEHNSFHLLDGSSSMQSRLLESFPDQSETIYWSYWLTSYCTEYFLCAKHCPWGWRHKNAKGRMQDAHSLIEFPD